MKVIHIIEASATGTLSMVSLLANAQVSNGNIVEIIYSQRPETPINFNEQFDERIILTRIQMYTGVDKFIGLKKLRLRLLDENPDVVFMHSSFAGFLGRLASIGILSNSRFLYLPHCISFMRQDVGFLRKLIFVGLELVGSIKKSEYIACSKSEQSAIQTYIPFKKCHLIENAVIFNGDRPICKFSTKSIVTVGQIRQQKGPLQFAEIAKNVMQKVPDASFTWIGDGDPIMRQKLEQAGVNVIGWVAKELVGEYLRGAGIYLSTAQWEGMPVSVIEAIYAGLPVVASKCSGNVDIINHNETGQLFDSPDQAVEYIVNLIAAPENVKRITDNAFEMAVSRFSVERYINEVNIISTPKQ